MLKYSNHAQILAMLLFTPLYLSDRCCLQIHMKQLVKYDALPRITLLHTTSYNTEMLHVHVLVMMIQYNMILGNNTDKPLCRHYCHRGHVLKP